MKNQQVATGIQSIFNAAALNMLANQNQPKKPKQKVFKYPYISNQDFKATLEKYDKYTQDYNNTLIDLNQDVKNYNKLVKAMQKAKKFDKDQAKILNSQFSKANNPLFVKDYNNLVELENKKLDCPVYKKRTYQDIKWNSVLFFKAILGFYKSQIKRNNARYLNTGRKTTRELEKVVLNSKQLAEAKMNDVILNQANKKTFQRHIKRLREAGVLVEYEFINPNKPIECAINSEILTISDHDPRKTQNPVKQFFKEKPGTKCTDNNRTTRTFLNEIEMKAGKPALERSSHTLTDNNLSYKNTSEIENPKNEGKPAAQNFAENSKKGVDSQKIKQIQVNSEALRANILDPFHFAKQLNNKAYNFYDPLPKDVLYHEAHYGLLNKGDYRQLVIQDLLKQMAVWWKNAEFHPGNWTNALKIIEKDWFVTFTGLEFDKVSIYNQLEEYHYRIKEVNRWLKSNKSFNILYPGAYFKPNRKHSFDGGWSFTRQWWTRHVSNKPKEDQQKRIDNKKAKDRKKYQDQVKRMRSKVRQMVAQKITLADLFKYVDTNGFPQSIIDMIPETISYYENI